MSETGPTEDKLGHEPPANAAAEEAATGAQPDDATPAAPSPAPRSLFTLELTYLAVLVAIGLLYFHSTAFRHFLPNPAGPVPLEIPWWGALGGVTISLTGIFRNANRWDSRYELWHIARPVLGAVVGSVAYLIFITVIRTTGAPLSLHPAPSGVVFDLVAFLVGYREQVFRELLKRATDSLFSSTSRDQENRSDEPKS